MTAAAPVDNQQQIEYWNSRAGDTWAPYALPARIPVVATPTPAPARPRASSRSSSRRRAPTSATWSSR